MKINIFWQIAKGDTIKPRICFMGDYESVRKSRIGLVPWLLMLFLTVNDTRPGFCEQCRSRSDCTERAVWSLIYAVHIFILVYNWTVSSSCSGSVFLANEKTTIYLFSIERVHDCPAAACIREEFRWRLGCTFLLGHFLNPFPNDKF